MILRWRPDGRELFYISTDNWLMAILGERPAMPDAATSANWTMVGICAHESAMKGGERVQIPRF